jgi:hypothetical protein
VRMHRAGRPLIPGGFRRPARWRGATCSGAQRGTGMSVDSFDAGKLPADLVARLSELEAAMAISPALAAKLAEFEALHAPYTEQAAKLAELQAHVVETSAAWLRESQRDAQRDLRAWRRDLDRSEELDFLVRERAAERRQRAAAGHAGNATPAVRPDRMQPPAALAAVVALRPTAAPAPAVQAPPLGADGWPSAEWIAARVEAIQSEQRRNRAWTATLLEEIGQPNTGTTRKRVQRACKAVADAKAAAAAAASEPPKAPAWPRYTMPKERTA